MRKYGTYIIKETRYATKPAIVKIHEGTFSQLKREFEELYFRNARLQSDNMPGYKVTRESNIKNMNHLVMNLFDAAIILGLSPRYFTYIRKKQS